MPIPLVGVFQPVFNFLHRIAEIIGAKVFIRQLFLQ
jgi:hypothetical protein